MARDIRVVFVGTPKGGVGKTTAVHTISTYLALNGVKVLTIDADTQTNLSQNVIESILDEVLSKNINKNFRANQFSEDAWNALQRKVFGAVEEILLVDQHKKNKRTAEREKRVTDILGKIDNALTNNTHGFSYIKEGRQAIEKKLRELMCATSLLDAFDWLDEGVAEEAVRKKAGSLIPNLISVLPPEHKGTGALYLLPGHHDFFLKYNGFIGLAVMGLNPKEGTFKTFASKLRAINYLIRSLAAARDVDVVFIDSNPAAIETNAALMMAASDYIIEPLTPEPHSDHALYSTYATLVDWKQKFNHLYSANMTLNNNNNNNNNNNQDDDDDDDNSHKVVQDGFPPVTKAPTYLGFILQKVPLKKNQVNGQVAKDIIESIDIYFREKLHPWLVVQGMAGNATLNQDYYKKTSIRFFNNSIKKLQKKGHAVVERADTQERSSMVGRLQERYKRIIYHLFNGQQENLTENFENALNKFGVEQENLDHFTEKWITHLKEWLPKITVAQRVKWIKENKPYFDMYDFKILLYTLQQQVFHSTDRLVENKTETFIANPFTLPNEIEFRQNDDYIKTFFPDSLLKDLKTVFTQWKKHPTWVIIPFLRGRQWQCLRLEFRKIKNGNGYYLDFLFDHPFGGVLHQSELSQGSSSKKSSIYVWDENLRRLLTRFFIVQFKTIFGNVNIRPIIRCKKTDQIGYPFRDDLTGFALIVNIDNYLRDYEDPNTNEKSLLNNIDFARSSAKQLMQLIIEEAGLDKNVFDPIEVDEEEYEDDDLYPMVNNKTAFKKLCEETLSNFFIQFDELEAEFEEELEIYHNDPRVKSFQDQALESILTFLTSGLMRILDDFHPRLDKNFQLLQEHNRLDQIFNFVITTYIKIYNNRKMLLKANEEFSEASIQSGLGVLEEFIKKLPTLTRSENTPRRLSQRTTRASVAVARQHQHISLLPRIAQQWGYFEDSIDDSQELTVDVQMDARLFDWGYRRIKADGDGNCFFSAVAKAMKEAKIRENGQRSDEQIYERTARFRQSAVDYFINTPELHIGFTGAETAQQFANRMRISAEYAEEQIIDALMRLLNIRITFIIYRIEDGELSTFIYQQNESAPPERSITLLLRTTHPPHYDAVFTGLHHTHVNDTLSSQLENLKNKFSIATLPNGNEIVIKDIEIAQVILIKLQKIININPDLVIQNTSNKTFRIMLTKEQYTQLAAHADGNILIQCATQNNVSPNAGVRRVVLTSKLGKRTGESGSSNDNNNNAKHTKYYPPTH